MRAPTRACLEFRGIGARFTAPRWYNFGFAEAHPECA